jgi:hypothetical protein
MLFPNSYLDRKVRFTLPDNCYEKCLEMNVASAVAAHVL